MKAQGTTTTEKERTQKREQAPARGQERHPSASERATEKAKTGEPLRAENPKERSPKQENL